MNISRVRGRMPLILAALLILSSIVAVGVYSRSYKSQKRPKGPRTYQAELVTVAPQVTSIVEGLQIAGVTLQDQGTPWASIIIDVINHRDEAVIALDFVAARGKSTSGGQGRVGSVEIPPGALIPPHTLERFTWHLSSILEGEKVELASAIFSDGKEEGDRESLQGLKRARLDSKKQLEENRRNGGQQ